MYLKSTGTCGVQEICSIAMDTPEELMMSFCVSLFEPKVQSKRYNNHSNVYDHHDGKPFCFYLFTAGNQKYSPYGKNFAKFIRVHKLGAVVETEEVRNDLYHPGHSNQAWLWSPDAKALKAWYNKAKKEEEDQPRQVRRLRR